MTAHPDSAPGAMTDADLVREHLEALGLSQREAARQLDVDDRSLRYYCAGKLPVPLVVFLALRQLEQLRLNDQCLALLTEGTMSTSDGELTAERLREANQKLRSAIELLTRPLRPRPAPAPDAASDCATMPRVTQVASDNNLLRPEWSGLESDDLRVLLENRIGGPGQVSGEPGDHRFYLPLAGAACRVALRFEGNSVSAVEPGGAFDAEQWSQISATVDALMHTAPDKVGRNIAFSSYRVTGSWRGEVSGVQILPPPAGAPSVPTEMGEHPFILEFPLHTDVAFPVTNARRLREHRRLALLLNVLLTARVNCEPRQTEHVWTARWDGSVFHSEWVQRSYFADFGLIVADTLTGPVGNPIERLAPEDYYATAGYSDGKALRVPTDLDESICRYRALTQQDREKFDRALYWLDVAARQWTTSMSSSFASLVSAIEALTVRGAVHSVYCPKCDAPRDHDAPGPTALFRNFFETYAPGVSQKKRRDEMYALRSGILHGSRLIAFDEGRGFTWDPPWNDQSELHRELWIITQIAMRNYLSNPSLGLPCRPSSRPGPNTSTDDRP